jgi:hypothetical protein
LPDCLWCGRHLSRQEPGWRIGELLCSAACAENYNAADRRWLEHVITIMGSSWLREIAPEVRHG